MQASNDVSNVKFLPLLIWIVILKRRVGSIDKGKDIQEFVLFQNFVQ